MPYGTVADFGGHVGMIWLVLFILFQYSFQIIRSLCQDDCEADVGIVLRSRCQSECDADIKIMRSLCQEECEADASIILRSRCQNECEADVRLNAKPMS